MNNNPSTHLASNESVEFSGPVYQFDIDLFCQDAGIPKEKALAMPLVKLAEDLLFEFSSSRKPVTIQMPCQFDSKRHIRTAFVYYRSWCAPVGA